MNPSRVDKNLPYALADGRQRGQGRRVAGQRRKQLTAQPRSGGDWDEEGKRMPRADWRGDEEKERNGRRDSLVGHFGECPCLWVRARNFS